MLCDRDGLVALPEWRPVVDDEANRVVYRNEYVVDEQTARLCDEHFAVLTGCETVAAAATNEAVDGR